MTYAQHPTSGYAAHPSGGYASNPSGSSSTSLRVADLIASHDVTKDGSNNVSAWGQFDVASATKPTWSTIAALNDQPALFFNTNMTLTRAGDLVAAGGDWTITIAYAQDNVLQAAHYALSWGAGSFGIFVAGADASVSQRPGLLNGTVLRVPSGTVTTSTPYVLTVRKTGTTYLVQLNGTGNAATSVMADIGLTGDLVLGNRTASLFMRGRLPRVIVEARSVPDAELAIVEKELCALYGATYVA